MQKRIIVLLMSLFILLLLSGCGINIKYYFHPPSLQSKIVIYDKDARIIYYYKNINNLRLVSIKKYIGIKYITHKAVLSIEYIDNKPAIISYFLENLKINGKSCVKYYYAADKKNKKLFLMVEEKLKLLNKRYSLKKIMQKILIEYHLSQPKIFIQNIK